MPVLIFMVVAVLALLALPPALKDKSRKRFFIAFSLSFFGILLPLVFFLLSAFLIPEAKDQCPNGWVDCFHVGKLALTPFVIWATAALYAVEIFRVRNRTRLWIVLGWFIGAVVSFVCFVLGVVSKGLEISPFLLAVPFYVSIWYAVRAVQLIRAGNVQASPLVMTATSSLPFWAAGVFWSYEKYLSLPDHPSGCFVVTAASQGHRKFVGPFREVTHRGQRRLANQQLVTFWQFEMLWRNDDPRSHAVFRHGYNIVGPMIARRIDSPLVADALFIVLKPAELLARLLIKVVMIRRDSSAPKSGIQNEYSF